ncbi:DMT family transporter [Flavobacterium laiguense]|uniref:DMT family transporter n=1 Tax=Flavobacterium laiguense TaxID=2169409 RepID=UPI001CB983AF|nr:EamA family transporter [Flavobacterium laiguense]
MSERTKELGLISTSKFKEWKLVIVGIAFAFLWSSASTATKIGLTSAQPFVISIFRFLIAGVIMLFVTHIVLQNRMPAKREWIQIGIYGFLNITFYLGLYVIAMQQVSAGLGSLAVATNPVFIAMMSAFWFSHRIKFKNILSLVLCFMGVILAAYPLLQNSYATPFGILILLVSMVGYSLGTIYYSRVNWNGLNILTINGWQTIFGGAFLSPVLWATYRSDKNIFDISFWTSVCWLAIPVSIGAVQFWLFLLKNNPIKASYWLFLCPIFGFIIAHFMMKEPISFYTVFGVAFVICGLYIVQKKSKI